MSLGDFLRSRRERLTLSDVGLVSYGRRRTPGLRREEVAQLAHIGTSWYTSLEQGRNVNPSEDVLNNLAKALRMTEDERRHLFLLARPAQQEAAEDQHVNIGLERMIKALDPNPSFVLGRCWDLLLWNKAAELVFRLPPYSGDMPPKLNWMRHLLSIRQPGFHIKDWEAGIPVLVAQFRADYAHFPNDAGFRELIEEFMQENQRFREIWPLHDVRATTSHHKRRYDPRVGEMEFEHVALQPPSHPDWKVMIYTASADTAARLQRILEHDK